MELLTVVAIIAVLATLLSATLSNAQRKARKTACIGNLRQVSLAVEMYRDDLRKRPDAFRSMVAEKYLTDRVLLCPEDKLVKNWAGAIESSRWGSSYSTPGADIIFFSDLPHSYFRGFAVSDADWDRILNNALGGVAACQLHGIGRQTGGPSLFAFQGLVLRALKDGSVITRQVFWSGNDGRQSPGGSPGGIDTPTTADLNGAGNELPLFIDEAP